MPEVRNKKGGVSTPAKKPSTTTKGKRQRSSKQSTIATANKRITRSQTTQSTPPSDDSRSGIDSESGKCFLASLSAFQKAEISEEEYFRNLLGHYTGIRHGHDNYNFPGRTIYEGELSADPVAQMIHRTSLTTAYQPLASTEECEELFASCIRDDSDGVIGSLEKLNSIREQIILPLAMLAAQRDGLTVFRVTVKEAVALKVDIYRVIGRYASRHLGILDVLWEENWRNIQRAIKPLVPMMFNAVVNKQEDRIPVLKWLLDHGGKIPGRDWVDIALYGVSTQMLEFLIVGF